MEFLKKLVVMLTLTFLLGSTFISTNASAYSVYNGTATEYSSYDENETLRYSSISGLPAGATITGYGNLVSAGTSTVYTWNYNTFSYDTSVVYNYTRNVYYTARG